MTEESDGTEKKRSRDRNIFRKEGKKRTAIYVDVKRE